LYAFFHINHVCYMRRPSNPPWFDDRNNILWSSKLWSSSLYSLWFWNIVNFEMTDLNEHRVLEVVELSALCLIRHVITQESDFTMIFGRYPVRTFSKVTEFPRRILWQCIKCKHWWQTQNWPFLGLGQERGRVPPLQGIKTT
jgi:hypothetical protein